MFIHILSLYKVYKKHFQLSFANNLKVTKLTKTKFTDNVTDNHRFVYAKFGGQKPCSSCVRWDFLK